jgi:transcriptional regulator with XRE-family HTH domain
MNFLKEEGEIELYKLALIEVQDYNHAMHGEANTRSIYLKAAEHVKIMRSNEGLTLEELASRIGSTKQTISDIERGIKRLDAMDLVGVARYFSISIDHLLGLNEEPYYVDYMEKDAKLRKLMPTTAPDEMDIIISLLETFKKKKM